MTYKLLECFRGLFIGQPYLHRRSNLGDKVASCLYEDLFKLGRSPKLARAVNDRSRVINIANTAVGKSARRGDGTFGEAVPGAPIDYVAGNMVAFGQVATIDIGTEVKILAKAMIKQLDRVGTDMINQVSEFKKHGHPLCIGVVGINFATSYLSFEGDRQYPTDGKKHKHPIQEAEQAERRLVERVSSAFDELIVLQFSATNYDPYPFEWRNEQQVATRYAASLIRISREYENRF